MQLRTTVNGAGCELEIADNELLLDVLRDRLRLTGTKRSCDVQVCGACTALVDDVPVSSCCLLAADVQGRQVQTIEGYAQSADYGRVAEVFGRHNAFQCGFCTPGFMMTLKPLLEQGALRSAEDVRTALAGNLCRCTGYAPIIDAVCELAGVTR